MTMWLLPNDYEGNLSYYLLGTSYLRFLLLGNACSLTFPHDIFIIHCFNLEYNGRYICGYYLNSAPDKFCHLECLQKNASFEMVCMNILLQLEISYTPGNTLTLVLIVHATDCLYRDKNLLQRAKLLYSCSSQVYHRLPKKTIV